MFRECSALRESPRVSITPCQFTFKKLILLLDIAVAIYQSQSFYPSVCCRYPFTQNSIWTMLRRSLQLSKNRFSSKLILVKSCFTRAAMKHVKLKDLRVDDQRKRCVWNPSAC